jgi:hypothetical protein
LFQVSEVGRSCGQPIEKSTFPEAVLRKNPDPEFGLQVLQADYLDGIFSARTGSIGHSSNEGKT